MPKIIENGGKPSNYHPSDAISAQMAEKYFKECLKVHVRRFEGKVYLTFEFTEYYGTKRGYLREEYWDVIVQEWKNSHEMPLAGRLIPEDPPFEIKGKGWVIQIDPQKNNCTHEDIMALKGAKILLDNISYTVKGTEALHGACGHKGSVSLLLIKGGSILQGFPPPETISPVVKIGPKDLSNPIVMDDCRTPPGVKVKTEVYTPPVPGYKQIAAVIEDFLKNPPVEPTPETIKKWRDTGLLFGVVTPGSQKEIVLVTMLENQRKMWESSLVK